MIALLVAAALAAAWDGEPATATVPPAVAATSPTPTPTPTLPTAEDLPSVREGEGDEPGWVDRSHAALTRGFVGAISWLDGFFEQGEHRDLDENRSALMLRQELRFESGPRVRPGVDARLDLRLPQLGERFRRLHVVVYAQSVAQGVADRVGSPRDGILAGPPRSDVADAAGGAAELRLDLLHALFMHADVGTGVHLQLPPGAYVHARLRSAFGVAPRTALRLTETAFLDSIQRLGVSAHGQLEHQPRPATLLRADGVAAVAQTSRGWEWGGELSALQGLTRSTALGASAGFSGHGQGGPVVDTWRLATKLRAEAFRRWLFVEGEPEVAWPLDPLTRERRRVFAFTVRLDVQFSVEPAPAALGPP